MELTIQEEVAKHREYYCERIKPLINKGEYQTAASELSNTLVVLDERREELFYEVHFGSRYLILGKMLEEKLKTAKSKKDLKEIVENFEKYLAQTEIPLVI